MLGVDCFAFGGPLKKIDTLRCNLLFADSDFGVFVSGDVVAPGGVVDDVAEEVVGFNDDGIVYNSNELE